MKIVNINAPRCGSGLYRDTYVIKAGDTTYHVTTNADRQTARSMVYERIRATLRLPSIKPPRCTDERKRAHLSGN